VAYSLGANGGWHTTSIELVVGTGL